MLTGRHDIDFLNSNAVVRSAHEGDPVTLTVWRGRIRKVTHFGASAEMVDRPAQPAEAAFIVALALLGLAAVSLIVAVLCFRDARGQAASAQGR